MVAVVVVEQMEQLVDQVVVLVITHLLVLAQAVKVMLAELELKQLVIILAVVVVALAQLAVIHQAEMLLVMAVLVLLLQ